MTDTKERRGDPTDASPAVDRVHLAGAGVLAAVVTVAATIIVAASTVNVLSGTAVDPGTLVAVAVVAAPVGIVLGARYRNRWVPPALVAGGLTAGFLFLRGFVQGQSVSYPLLFGLPGAAVAVGFMLGGAWAGARLQVMRGPSQVSSLTRAGLVVAGGWTAIEFLFRLGVTLTVGSMLGNTFASVLVATTIGFPVAALFAVRYGRRMGIDREDWGYQTSGRTVGVGLVAGVLTAFAVQGVGLFVSSVIGTDATVAAFGFLLTDLEAGLWVLALFVLTHGIVAPLAEELAWRGIVQTALVESRGPAVGIATTAVLFTAKHAVLDASFARVPTLFVLAVGLGVVRDRWGTTASTLVHSVVNLVAIVGVAIFVFG